jgi:hypothetical protein
MPGFSKQTAPNAETFGPVTDHHDDIDGYTVSIVSFGADIDGAPLMKGLPDDRCQCPHWGYVVQGTVTFTFADHVEDYAAGDAFYVPPGHTPAHSADSEIVLFSPAHELALTEAAIERNMQAPPVTR